MRHRVALVLALLAGPVWAEPADCPGLARAFEVLSGYRVQAPVAGPRDGWCVFDRAALTAAGAPDLVAERLRIRGEISHGALADLALSAAGVRLAPGLGRREMDPTLRETLRLQTADVAFVVSVDAGGVALRQGELRLSAGTELLLEADIAGAGRSAGSLVSGRLTRLQVDWRNDGRLLRPVMEHWGTSLADGAEGAGAVDAARLALRHVVQNLPPALFHEEGQARLAELVDALPQGPGRLRVDFGSSGGLGAAQVAVATFSGDPLGPEALARLFSGAQVHVEWQPGLSP